MKYLKKYWVPTLLILVLFYEFVISESIIKRKDIICKVEKVDIASTGAICVYQEGKEVYFKGFSFYKNEDIRVGDSLVKPSNKMVVYQYRIDSTSNKYELINEFHK